MAYGSVYESSVEPFVDMVVNTPLKLGTIAGAVAFGVGYLICLVVSYLGLYDLTGPLTDVLRDGRWGEVTVWMVAGWLWYNAHYVALQVPNSGFHNMIESAALPHLLVVYTIPPIVLVAAGFVTVSLSDDIDSLVDAASVGSAITIPYLFLSTVGIFLFRISSPVVDGTVGPAPVIGFALAGLVYPLFYGIIGGVAALRIGQRNEFGQ